MSEAFTFPYAWSNPGLSQEKLVFAVLERGLFEDLCRLALRIGVPALRAAQRKLPAEPLRDAALERMLSNIAAGFSRV